MKKILLFSSLCKSKSILEVALPSWINQETDGFEYDIVLFNDNKEEDAIVFTQKFETANGQVKILNSWLDKPAIYEKHHWTHESVNRIIDIKNKALELAIAGNYDYVFLVDADLVLHPKTLNHLFSLKKDFVFEVFWTVFTDQLFAKPNCWDVHSWDYYNADSILKLKEPGTYEVGAGGACTLLSINAIKAGVHFSKIKNMPYGGEDRHICTRAEVLGFKIYVDTHYPAFHIYDGNLVTDARQWQRNGCDPSYFNQWLDGAWRINVINSQKNEAVHPPKHKWDKIKTGLYKARRAYINYMRYN